jgi:hypothetical protein
MGGAAGPLTWAIINFGGPYGTHDDANPCQTSTDTEYRCFSVVPCQAVN